MFRPPLLVTSAAALTAVLALTACDRFSAAGDTDRPIPIVAVADQSLPEPAVEELAPVCAAPDPAMIARLEEQVNAERVRLGRSPLKFKENLAFAAQAHACDMASMNRLTVAGSNGSSVVNRVRAVEYTACSSAQLIGRAGDDYSQMSRWMGYKPDQEILVHNKFDDAGVGVVQSGGTYWWSLVLADHCG
ncbi:CAP domain-containing protein [Paracoccus aurantiacus]|uniref:CAP domain-containing protein n=1 Tax=Paracoccus aurantiacus TaxID=2599412 RepID=A0A5C6S2F6_9RHOB|nr:CAP domain-containing protein [Paracoccus aurantiacus]TXB68648.1 CAP domain-containing protein [Paracoccus aurantiacus]